MNDDGHEDHHGVLLVVAELHNLHGLNDGAIVSCVVDAVHFDGLALVQVHVRGSIAAQRQSRKQIVIGAGQQLVEDVEVALAFGLLHHSRLLQ